MEDNNSILSNLCSQPFFTEIFNNYKNPAAFLTIKHDIIWSNDLFNQNIHGADILAKISSENSEPFTGVRQFVSEGTNQSFYLFPVIFENDLLGFIAIFTNDINQNSFDLNSIKHDLNNILTIVFNLLKKQSKPDHLTYGIESTKELLDNLSSGKTLSAEVIDTNIVLVMLSHSFIESLKGKVDFNIQTEPDLYPIRIDKSKFIRVITNIITNSYEAFLEKGTIELRAINLHTHKGNFVEITISDNGIGIPADALKHIFDANYSTKNRGSGIGLAIVKKLMDESNSGLEVQSEINNGARFTLTFPAISRVKHSVAIIEDEPMINELLTGLLSEQYTVFSFLDAESFLANSIVLQLDAAIIDKKLPGMDGIDCIKKLTRTNSSVKIIFATGSESFDEVPVYDIKIDKIIRKPYNFDQLLSAVEELLP